MLKMVYFRHTILLLQEILFIRLVETRDNFIKHHLERQFKWRTTSRQLEVFNLSVSVVGQVEAEGGFAALGFYTVGQSSLTSVLSTALTYLIILYQFKQGGANPTWLTSVFWIRIRSDPLQNWPHDSDPDPQKDTDPDPSALFSFTTKK